MADQFERSRMLLGDRGMERLRRSAVAVFGIGGVGSFAAEALVRSGIGRMAFIDNDEVSLSNLNRQLIATYETLGQKKVEAMAQRAHSIRPDMEIETYPLFYNEETADSLDLSRYDYVVDAIDTVSSKLLLILRARQAGTPIISSMGTGNKLDPARLEISDIYETSVCPLARVMRRELKRRGVESLTVVYSREQPAVPDREQAGGPALGPDGLPLRKQPPGSTAFVPSAAGLMIAAKIVREICGR